VGGRGGGRTVGMARADHGHSKVLCSLWVLPSRPVTDELEVNTRFNTSDPYVTLPRRVLPSPRRVIAGGGTEWQWFVK
jgi:hypothetical protein